MLTPIKMLTIMRMRGVLVLVMTMMMLKKCAHTDQHAADKDEGVEGGDGEDGNDGGDGDCDGGDGDSGDGDGGDAPVSSPPPRHLSRQPVRGEARQGGAA